MRVGIFVYFYDGKFFSVLKIVWYMIGIFLIFIVRMNNFFDEKFLEFF